MNTLNIPEVKKYASDLSSKLTDDFFKVNEFITAMQIANFCKIKQLNLFIIKSLFEKWQGETKKLQSPYFDYQHKEVKDALQQFLNILSQHISLKKEVFKQLLTKAIEETLLLGLSPHIYFHNYFSSLNNEDCSLEQIKKIVKYFQINKILLTESIKKIDNSLKERSRDPTFNEGKTTFSIELIIKYFDEFYDSHQEDIYDPQTLIDEFSELSPISKEKLLSEDSSFKELESSAEQGLSSLKPGLYNSGLKKDKSLNKRFTKEQLSLYDSLKQSHNIGKTIYQSHERKAIKSFTSAIALNQRHFFINELFNSENRFYEEAIEKLEQCKDYNEAISLVTENYAVKYNWDMDKKSVEEFIELIERRFQ